MPSEETCYGISTRPTDLTFPRAKGHPLLSSQREEGLTNTLLSGILRKVRLFFVFSIFACFVGNCSIKPLISFFYYSLVFPISCPGECVHHSCSSYNCPPPCLHWSSFLRSFCLYCTLIPGKEFRQTQKELVQTTLMPWRDCTYEKRNSSEKHQCRDYSIMS